MKNGFVKFIILVIIVIGVFVVINYISSPATKTSLKPTIEKEPVKQFNKSWKNLTLNEKMRRAEDYLKQYKIDIDGFFVNIERANLPPGEMQTYMSKYNKIIESYTGKINSLQLVCPTSKKASDPKYRRYRNWTRDFQERDQKIMNEANEKIQKILKKAGFSTR